MNYLLKDLAIEDVESCFDQIDAATEYHAKWLQDLYLALEHAMPDDHPDLQAEGHQRCEFGRWYYREHPLLARYEEYAELEAIHRDIHAQAHRMLRKARSGESEVGDYARLAARTTEMRRLLTRLESRLKYGLSAATRLTARVFENAGEAVIITDSSGVILDVNKAFTRVTGYTHDEAIGRTPALLASGRHDRAFYDRMWRALREEGEWQGEIWNRRKNGEIYPEWLSITTVTEPGQGLSNYVAMFSDITVAKRNEERLAHLAHYDPLTDLPNRALFHDRLSQAIERAQRNRYSVALLLVDLDRFKLVNDTLGHTAGDNLLVDVAGRLRHCVRSSDTVARLGGDEFVVLLPEVAGKQGAAQVAEKILEVMTAPFRIQGREMFVSPSIGISLFPQLGNDEESLIKAADWAMYRAKEQGRNTYQFFRTEGLEHAGELFALENDLRRALERGELKLVYQPQVEVESGRLLGVEALLRWHHPGKGLIGPDEFIPVAEESGLINPIGDWVLREACGQARQWQEQGIGPFRLSVNVSARQLRQPRFAERVAHILDESGVAPEHLDLEITESSVMQNAEHALGLLNQLCSIGVRISIDDFGSGYTSLSYLKRFPIATVNISGVAHDSDSRALSRGIISLADGLGLRVIAEGVETVEQRDFLREHNCCEAQGFLYGRPAGPEEIIRIFRTADRSRP